jgi:muramoyltetrapeptide carboxypeptidase LdcA involved in peptidoglycan recycling
LYFFLVSGKPAGYGRKQVLKKALFCTECTPAKSSFEVNLSMSDLLDEILGDLGKPVLSGLVFGHTKEKATLPMSVAAELR